ncbi:DUF1566 domain-containing protein [Cellvibrio sp. PSBB006]|uniref:Lcl C-terminal domain-containing protein n=1 Tax=Cellvibrio sp. PSBB006 TaxID=1987723 RepID=UPI0012F7FC95|nr:DUF1566 domain-containing protein [Cellvibrio sp. PSBB006]
MSVSASQILTIVLIFFLSTTCLSSEGNTSRFTIKNESVVLDLEFNILWTRCSLGQTPSMNKCEGEAIAVDPATGMPKEFNYNDEAGWRLPTPQELSSLVICSSGLRARLDEESDGGGCEGEFTAPTINTEIFPDTPTKAAFWSDGGCGGYAMATYFQNGSTYCYTLNDGPQYVRLVRDL